ncbi:hypothetical protein Tco_1128623 [Tanacetum coccineum]
MHTRASNCELVEPLPKPERTLNQRLCRRNGRVPFEQRNEPPSQPRVVYVPILDINYFRHFLDIHENYNPMDDETMWAADRVVAPTPGSTITIPETANEFTIKGNHLTLVKGNQFNGMPVQKYVLTHVARCHLRQPLRRWPECGVPLAMSVRCGMWTAMLITHVKQVRPTADVAVTATLKPCDRCLIGFRPGLVSVRFLRVSHVARTPEVGHVVACDIKYPTHTHPTHRTPVARFW